MKSFKNLIDCVYIINLDSRNDRYQKIVDECKQENITNYVRFPAVQPSLDNGDYTTALRIHKFSNRDNNYVRGSLGCKLSHLAILKHAKRKGHNMILILEDDVEFKLPYSLVHLTMDTLKSYDFCFLYLSANLYGAKLTQKTPNIAMISNAFCAHSYVVNCKYLDYLIKGIEKSPHEVDVFYKQVQYEKPCYIMTPGITRQRSDYSDIQNRKVVYESIG